MKVLSSVNRNKNIRGNSCKFVANAKLLCPVSRQHGSSLCTLPTNQMPSARLYHPRSSFSALQIKQTGLTSSLRFCNSFPKSKTPTHNIQRFTISKFSPLVQNPKQARGLSNISNKNNNPFVNEPKTLTRLNSLPHFSKTIKFVANDIRCDTSKMRRDVPQVRFFSTKGKSGDQDEEYPDMVREQGWPTPFVLESLKKIEKRVTKIVAKVHPDRVASSHPSYGELNQKSFHVFRDYFQQLERFIIKGIPPMDLFDKQSPMQVRFIYRKGEFHPVILKLYLPGSFTEQSHSAAAFSTIGIINATLDDCEKIFQKLDGGDEKKRGKK